MAPKGIEDIDFPDICDKILKFLEAVFILIVEKSEVLWSYVCHGAEAVWTWPPFEAFRNEFVAALLVVMDYVVTHPITSAAIFFLGFVVVTRTLACLQLIFLHCLGFREEGVLRGSVAANYQATSYGGNVPRGSTFSRYQSQGATSGRAYAYRTTSGTGASTFPR